MSRPRTGARGGAGATAWVLRTTLLVSAVAALLVFHIWTRTRVLTSGYELGELQRAHARLTLEHDRLRLEVESLRAPATLERLARTKLQMAPPAPGTVRVAGPATATAAADPKGGDGVDHRTAPAGSAVGGRAAAGARGEAPGGAAARDAGVPGEQVALRGPLREVRSAPEPF